MSGVCYHSGVALRTCGGRQITQNDDFYIIAAASAVNHWSNDEKWMLKLNFCEEKSVNCFRSTAAPSSDCQAQCRIYIFMFQCQKMLLEGGQSLNYYYCSMFYYYIIKHVSYSFKRSTKFSFVFVLYLPLLLLFLFLFLHQSTQGPCNTPKPGMLDFVNKVKWDAWKSLGSISQVLTLWVSDVTVSSRWNRNRWFNVGGKIHHETLQLVLRWK